MPRKYVSTEKFRKNDPKYDNRLAAQFINCLMLDGKKSKAEAAFYEALDEIARLKCWKKP